MLEPDVATILLHGTRGRWQTSLQNVPLFGEIDWWRDSILLRQKSNLRRRSDFICTVFEIERFIKRDKGRSPFFLHTYRFFLLSKHTEGGQRLSGFRFIKSSALSSSPPSTEFRCFTTLADGANSGSDVIEFEAKEDETLRQFRLVRQRGKFKASVKSSLHVGRPTC